jgi:dynactin complex subunit
MEKFDKVVAHNTLLSEQLAEMQQKISNFTTSKSVFDQIEEENKRLKEEVAAAADLMAMGERATAEIERLRGELEKRRKVENELCELGDEAATELNRLRAELKHIKSMQK